MDILKFVILATVVGAFGALIAWLRSGTGTLHPPGARRRRQVATLMAPLDERARHDENAHDDTPLRAARGGQQCV